MGARDRTVRHRAADEQRHPRSLARHDRQPRASIGSRIFALLVDGARDDDPRRRGSRHLSTHRRLPGRSAERTRRVRALDQGSREPSREALRRAICRANVGRDAQHHRRADVSGLAQSSQGPRPEADGRVEPPSARPGGPSARPRKRSGSGGRSPAARSISTRLRRCRAPAGWRSRWANREPRRRVLGRRSDHGGSSASRAARNR